MILEWVRENVVGRHATIRTPFGTFPKRYFDYTASGLPFSPIEDLVRERVLPWMANTHTDASAVGGYMTELYEESMRMVRAHAGAGDDDVVIFTGHGATSAINKLVRALAFTPADKPVVFISKMEHISNDLPWRESAATVEMVGFDERGRVSPDELVRLLEKYRDHPLKIGSFSAASNVTGIKNDVDALARAMHAHGGYACFDYAAAAPYADIELRPKDESARKDAVFISMHKFLGGPQAPGLLIANKALFRSKVPVEPGGGTVVYHSPWDWRYTDDVAHREEGGTPNIVGVIRAGLAVELKEAIGTVLIHDTELAFVKKATERLAGHKKIAILGDAALPRLGILSLILDEGRLHYNLAARLLSDRYGIQTRGGAMCAGAYGAELMDGLEGFSFCGDVAELGWVRASFSPATTDDELDTLLDALVDVAENWKQWAPQYAMAKSGTWRHERDVEQKNHSLRLITPRVS
jgi:selenocysteine lyase/cysteine desulfurase